MSLEKDIDPIITINIGNKLFSSHKKVLDKSLYFTGLFNFYSNAKTDYSDHFIDRDPDIFGYLLNCLRDPNYIDVQKLINYKPDIIYYQIESLLTLIEENKTAEDKFTKFIVTRLSDKVNYEITDSIIKFQYDTKNRPYDLITAFGGVIIKTGLKIIIPNNCIGLLNISSTNMSEITLKDPIYPSKIYDHFEIAIYSQYNWYYLNIIFHLYIVQLHKL